MPEAVVYGTTYVRIRRGSSKSFDVKPVPEGRTSLNLVVRFKAVVDEARRRVQKDTTGHRGRKADPLHKIRRLLTIGAEHLKKGMVERIVQKLRAGDPDWEVTKC